MNGRVYDPVVGRFLSVDPVFQFPEDTQSLNPYSYVRNSPLSATDPTGFCEAEKPCEAKASGGKTEGGKQAKQETAADKSSGERRFRGSQKNLERGGNNTYVDTDLKQAMSGGVATESGKQEGQGVSTGAPKAPDSVGAVSDLDAQSQEQERKANHEALDGSVMQSLYASDAAAPVSTPIESEINELIITFEEFIGDLASGAGGTALLVGAINIVSSMLPGPKAVDGKDALKAVRTEPGSLQDQMTLEAAKKGSGQNLGLKLNDARYKGMEKWQYVTESNDGVKSVVHYVRNPDTGELMDFKFTMQTGDYIPNSSR
jgi:hypothetical protein